MSHQIAPMLWPTERLPEALETLAHAAGLSTKSISGVGTDHPAETVIDFCSNRLKIEAESVSILAGEEADFVHRAAPAILKIYTADESVGHLLLLSANRRSVQVIGPDSTTARIPLNAVAERLVAPLAAGLEAELNAITQAIGGNSAKQSRVKQAILKERLSGHPISAGWILRPSQQSGLWAQLTRERVPKFLAGYLLLQLIQFGCWYGSWAVIGRMVFSGRFDTGLFGAWALLLLSMVPLRGLAGWLQGQISVRAGMLVKQRLMAGALNLSPDQTRSQGIGQLLGRVHESEAVETLVFRGGFLLLTAVIELFYAFWVLALGSSSSLHISLLIGWMAVAVWVGYRYLKQRELWTDSRLKMTHDLIEQMLGHRTRQMQGNRATLNDEQDGFLARYFTLTHGLINWVVWLTVGIPRGWLVLAILSLVPTITLNAFSSAELAISIGGILAAYVAFEHLTMGMQTLSGAQVAADRIRELLESAGRESEQQLLPTIKKDGDQQADQSPLVVGRNLVYRYPQRQRPILNGVDLEILRGEKLLLEGSSGGGKSTLAAVLTGLRRPDSGLLLVDGHDLKSLGEQGWRNKIASAPQFHENHVLTETFAFNLLMGRNWPPTRADIEAAYKICYGLGLGPLLERMPGGLNQMVGDTGWQLSHGERNRLFLARALLQSADLVVLDESLAGLDPATYKRAMATIEAEANTVLMILHR